MPQPAVNENTTRYLIVFPHPTNAYEAGVYDDVSDMLDAENGVECTVYWISYPAGELIEVEILCHLDGTEFEILDAAAQMLLEYVLYGEDGQIAEHTIYGTDRRVGV